MPMTGIILIYALKMHPMEALATFLFATSPGGGTSNLVCYYMDFNLELSITLTFFCTVAAFGYGFFNKIEKIKLKVFLNENGIINILLMLSEENEKILKCKKRNKLFKTTKLIPHANY